MAHRNIKALASILVLGGCLFAFHAKAEIGILDNLQISGVYIDPDQPVGSVLWTASNGSINVPVYLNPELSESGWIEKGDALPVLPTWAEAGQTWRPQLIKIFNKAAQKHVYVMYFSARNPSLKGAHCLGVATSNTAIGPYVSASPQPLLCVSGREVIDPTPFRDDDGTLYLTWKLGGALAENQPTINLSQLSADGLRIVGSPTELMTNDPQSWEGLNVEAPFLTKRFGSYFLFYSGNLFQTKRYGVGYAVSSTTVTGPYVKNSSNPILSSSAELGYGPGEETVFSDRCGDDWLGFSDYDRSDALGPPNQRHFHAVRLVWPLIPTSPSSTYPNPAPAVEFSIDAASNFSICPGTPTISPGFFLSFVAGNSTVFYANQNHACGFDTWEHFIDISHITSPQGLTLLDKMKVYSPIPDELAVDGICTGN